MIACFDSLNACEPSGTLFADDDIQVDRLNSCLAFPTIDKAESGVQKADCPVSIATSIILHNSHSVLTSVMGLP